MQQIARERNCKIERSFVWWYCETKFGKQPKGPKIHVTDGDHDGGIDAIIHDGGLTYIIQSEFCNRIFQGKQPPPLSPQKYTQFDTNVSIFKDNTKLDEYLTSVDGSLHVLYKKTAQEFQKEPNAFVWEITTLHRPSKSGERRLVNLDCGNLHYCDYNLRLFQLDLEGATPLARPLELSFVQHFNVDDRELGINSYVLQALLRDFIDYVDQDPNFNIISRNVRNEIKNSPVNPGITKTFLNRPEEFWYSHNGITIICEKASISGNKILLKGPNIINGAQTIHAIKYQKKRDPKAKVLVRVVELRSESDNTKEMIENIIFRTNQQNKIYAYDLKANDPLQVDLARKFLHYKVYYDRRRGDWDQHSREYRNEGLERLRSTTLAQILVACEYSRGGVITAKDDVEALFTDDQTTDHYNKIYSTIFDRPFEETLFKFQLFKSVKESLKQIKSKRINRRLRNTTLFICSAIAWESVEPHKDLKRFYESVKANNRRLDVRSDGTSYDFVNAIQTLFKDCWSVYRIEDKKVGTISPSDFFNKTKKWNVLLRKRFVPKYRSRIQSSIEKMLA